MLSKKACSKFLPLFSSKCSTRPLQLMTDRYYPCLRLFTLTNQLILHSWFTYDKLVFYWYIETDKPWQLPVVLSVTKLSLQNVSNPYFAYDSRVSLCCEFYFLNILFLLSFASVPSQNVFDLRYLSWFLNASYEMMVQGPMGLKRTLSHQNMIVQWETDLCRDK